MITRPSFDEARTIAHAAARVLGAERVALADALGRVLAVPVRAVNDHPCYDMAAMDGFAFAAALAANAGPDRPVHLPVVGAAPAGYAATYLAGSAMRIGTGAAIPTGCDAVLAREERAAASGDVLTLSEPARYGLNVRRRGEDAATGEEVADRGVPVTPEMIGALACYGVDAVEVHRRPVVAILSTGDELCAGGVRDANGPMIAAMCAEAGAVALRLPVAADDLAQLTFALEHAMALRPDVLVSSGSVSVGDRDLMPEALRMLGATTLFHGVAMRPGKPVLFATLPGGPLCIGLPGNPVAAAVGFRFFVSASIRAMRGQSPEDGVDAALDAAPRPGLTLLLKVQRDGEGRVRALVDQRSHTMRPLIGANGWAAVDGDQDEPRVRFFKREIAPS